MPRLRPRVVCDCMIFLQTVARVESSAGSCIRLFELGIIELFLSEETLAELQAVLTRESVRKKLRTITDERVERLMSSLRNSARIVGSVPRVFEYARDPKDEPYINLAVVAKASFLVTRDRDLLDLADPVSPDGARLTLLAPDLRIMAPETFLETVRYPAN
jgi:uncharacterized protein